MLPPRSGVACDKHRGLCHHLQQAHCGGAALGNLSGNCYTFVAMAVCLLWPTAYSFCRDETTNVFAIVAYVCYMVATRLWSYLVPSQYELCAILMTYMQ